MVMPSQVLERAVFGKTPIIVADHNRPITEDQIQPSSIDLRLDKPVVKVMSSLVPSRSKYVTDLIEKEKQYGFDLSLFEKNQLDKGATYIIRLKESLALPAHQYAEFSPKSSTGRSDVFVRVICDKQPHFDVTPPGYHGPLFALVTPLSFNVSVKEELPLLQMRIKEVNSRQISGVELSDLHRDAGLLFDKEGVPLPQQRLHIRGDEIYYHLDLQQEIVGFAARQTCAQALDMTASKESGLLDPTLFWEPIRRPKGGTFTIMPGVFYLLATEERVSIPQGYCAQMNTYDTSAGEFRTHYAGFFDPGFGSKGGTAGVLEVRANATPFTFEHGHPICSMKFEKLSAPSAKVYEGNYTKAGPSLGKHFAHRDEVWTRAFWSDSWNQA